MIELFFVLCGRA